MQTPQLCIRQQDVAVRKTTFFNAFGLLYWCDNQKRGSTENRRTKKRFFALFYCNMSLSNTQTPQLTVEQVIELVKQLPPGGKQAVVNVLSAERDMWWDETLIQGEQQMRRLCVERGLDWNNMSEEEREVFVDELLHEDK